MNKSHLDKFLKNGSKEEINHFINMLKNAGNVNIEIVFSAIYYYGYLFLHHCIYGVHRIFKGQNCSRTRIL